MVYSRCCVRIDIVRSVAIYNLNYVADVVVRTRVRKEWYDGVNTREADWRLLIRGGYIHVRYARGDVLRQKKNIGTYKGVLHDSIKGIICLRRGCGPEQGPDLRGVACVVRDVG